MTPRVSLPLPVPLACLLFVVGVALVALLPEHGNTSLLIGMSATLGTAVGICASLALRRAPSAVLLCALALGVGAWRAASVLAGQAQPWDAAPTGLMRASAIVQSVEERGATARIVVQIEQMLSPERLDPPAGLIQLTVRALPPYEPGDRIEINGRMVPAQPTTIDGRRMLARGIVASSSYPRIVPNGHVARGFVESTLRNWRTGIDSAISRALPEPEASLLRGLLVGSSQGTPESFREALVASGTTHIVVVSGFNITLVAAFLLALTRPLGRWSLVAALLGVWLFALVAGGTSPTLRAAIMGTIGLLAIQTGRGRDALLALALTSALLIFVDPAVVTDLSFLLSALATLGLIALQPRVAALMPWLPEPIRTPLAATLAAELTTLPILIWIFHQVSLVSPLSNILVAPLIPVATIVGAVGVAMILTIPPLTPAVGLVLMAPCRPIVGIVEATAAFPSAISPIGDISPLLIGLYGLGLLVWAVAPTPEGRALRDAGIASPLLRPAIIVAVSLVAFVAIAAGTRGADATGPLVVTVLNVDHGDGVFVRTPRGQAILIDGGPNPPALLAGIGKRMGFVERSFGLALLTRADADHLPGMVAALDRYSAGLQIGPTGANVSALEQRWRAAAPAGRMLSIDSPTSLNVEPDLVLDVFPTAPIGGPRGVDGSPQRSLLVRIQYGSVSMLIAPTATPGEIARAKAAGWNVSADALVVPRHGGKDSLEAGTIAMVRPSIALISVSARNREGAPTKETLALLDQIRVFRTDLHGSIELTTDGSSLRVTPERSP